MDTEFAEAGRRGTEFSVGVDAIAGFTRQMKPEFPRPDPQAFLRELRFALCGLGDAIGLQN